MRRPLLFIGVMILAIQAKAEVPQPPALILTSQENGTEAQDSFSCSGTLHGYVTLDQAAVGPHQLEGIWIGPKGKEVQHSHDEIRFDPPGRRTAYVWLRFAEGGRGIWNPISIQQPGDEERALYDGPWTLTVRWDGKPIAKTTFQVHCQKL